MFPLFESIKIENGHITHWDLHWKRMQNSAKELWGEALSFPTLYHELAQFNSSGLFKCKIKYNQHTYSIERQDYLKKQLQCLLIVEDQNIDYHLKYTNRSCFEKHTKLLSPTEDILIVKNNLLSDASYSNIALWNGEEWHTPKLPLLHGIRREALLQKQRLIEKDIQMEDLINYQKISLINAMLNLGELELDVQRQIILP